jgi:FlaA1/EpsC-like NDP-sugar epimerase
MTSRLHAAPRPPWAFSLHRRTQFLLDLLGLSAAFWAVYLLRFDFRMPAGAVENALAQMPLVVLVQFIALYLFRVYTLVWRYVGMREIAVFARAAVSAMVPLLVLRLALPDTFAVWRVPISVILVDTVLAFGGLLALRVLRRVLYERFERSGRERRRGDGERVKPVLLVGAGRAGVLAVRELQNRGDTGIEPLGFVDDDPLKQGMVIHGVKVLGGTPDIPRLARELAVDHVILTIADARPEEVRRIVALCERQRLPVRTIPGLYEVLRGDVSFSRFRDIDMADLLGRDPVQLDEPGVERYVAGRCVMVTGAGGSIGSELARQLARFAPSRLVLVERAEAALFDVHRELGELWPDLPLEPVIADVGDAGRMEAVLGRLRPQVIFHAAAHKHVPLMESNTDEAVKNNVLGTHVVARLAGEHGVEAFILISTDKAVRPTSVMGATKRVAELVTQKLSADFPATRFLAVRFGNVLGSAGSVIPIFRQQIAHGGPVRVTHPEMRRYFMTIPEAAQLVVQAGALGDSGEILVLDMGEPVRILDLARRMIELSGFVPGQEIPIVFSGLRPGEKLFEEIELDGEAMDRTRHPKIFIGRLRPPAAQQVEWALARLAALAEAGDERGLRRLLGEVVPEATLEAAAGGDGQEAAAGGAGSRPGGQMTPSKAAVA